MTLVNKVKDKEFSASGLRVLELDAVITPGTIFCYDLADPNSWPSQASPCADDTVFNLVEGGDNALIGASSNKLTWDGYGFDGFDLSGSENILLPTAAKLESNTGGFIVAVWLNALGQPQAEAGNVFGYLYNSSGPWGCYYSNPNYIFIINGESVALPSSALQNGPHQIGLAWSQNGDGSYQKELFLDGALVHSSLSAYDSIQSPSTLPNHAVIGDSSGSTGKNNWWHGSIYRFWMEDLSVADATDSANVAEWLAYDWSENDGRFEAL